MTYFMMNAMEREDYIVMGTQYTQSSLGIRETKTWLAFKGLLLLFVCVCGWCVCVRAHVCMHACICVCVGMCTWTQVSTEARGVWPPWSCLTWVLESNSDPLEAVCAPTSRAIPPAVDLIVKVCLILFFFFVIGSHTVAPVILELIV